MGRRLLLSEERVLMRRHYLAQVLKTWPYAATEADPRLQGAQQIR